MAKCEPADYLLVVDPRFWPAGGFNFTFIADEARRYQGATHAIAVGANGDGTRERVEYDPSGQIRRVQRLYSPTSWPATTAATVFCSAVPARAIRDMTFEGLGDLRRQLVGQGVLAQDLPVLSEVDNLTSQAGVLACSQRTLDRLLDGPAPSGLRSYRPGVLIGAGCRVDPSARLVPPILIQDFTTIEAEAMLVGPVVIGAGSCVGRRAVVAQSIIMPNSHIAEGAAASNAIGGPVVAAAAPPAIDAADHAAGKDLQACEWQTKDLALQDLPRPRRLQHAIKRLLDIVLSLGGLILLSPVLVIAALLVKYTSPGPVLFVHRREGKGGRTFGCLKFRTMVADAHARQRELYRKNQVDGPQFKMDDDPRVTSVGGWLRALNIDELPQLFNVLAGQMSLVGPRPSPFRENQICVAWRRARLSVRPGITGLWQICRDRRSDGDFHQWIFYDITYVRHFSLRLDLRILYYTLLSGGGRRRVPMRKVLAVEDPTDGGRQGIVDGPQQPTVAG